MRRTNEIFNIRHDVSLPSEEFYVTRDPDEKLGKLIAAHLILPAQARAAGGEIDTSQQYKVDNYIVPGKVDYHFRDTKNQYGGVRIIVRNYEISDQKIAGLELNAVYNLLKKSSLLSNSHDPNFTSSTMSFSDMESAEITYFSESRYLIYPLTGALSCETVSGYDIDGLHVYMFDSQGADYDDIDPEESEILSEQEERMRYTLNHEHITEIVRALFALELINQDEVRRFVSQLP